MTINKEWPLEPFSDLLDAQAQRQEWTEWKRAFELLAESKGIVKQRELFVNLLSRGGRVLQRIYYNKKPVDGEVLEIRFPRVEIPEYENAVLRLDDYFEGKGNPRIELEVFRSIRQKEDENFNKFLVRLRLQGSRCAFNTREDEEILHQITIGAKSEKVRDKGLEGSLSLDSLVQYAIAREIVESQKQSIKEEKKVEPMDVAFIQRKRNFMNKGTLRSCFRCGSYNHNNQDMKCPAKNETCHKCNNKGHFARKCRSKPRHFEGKANFKGPKSINHVIESDESGMKDNIENYQEKVLL